MMKRFMNYYLSYQELLQQNHDVFGKTCFEYVWQTDERNLSNGKQSPGSTSLKKMIKAKQKTVEA